MSSLRVVLRVPREEAPIAEDASNATSSADEDLSDDEQRRNKKLRPLAPKKKRKSSYHVRKEAMSELREQEEALRAQLEEIQAREMSGGSRGSSLQHALRENGALKTRVGVNRLAIAGVQSLTSSLSQIEASPLSDYIHLPSNPLVRRQVLESLRARKVDAAVRFILARAQAQDLRRRTRQIETFETDDGDHIVLDWGVAKFEQPQLEVKMVYDEVINFSQTHEMTLADKLGVIAIRESDICPDIGDVAEVRMVSSRAPNLLVEKHVTVFTQYFQRSELFDEPHGMLVFDYVDQDDLHPYQPLTRLRKDISSATMVMQCPPLTTSPDEVPAVALVKWSYGRIHKSPLATEDQLESIAREGAFFDLMVQTVRERLAWQAS